ncbi:hypothetical protein OROMI_027973 [Orobanche minor]
MGVCASCMLHRYQHSASAVLLNSLTEPIDMLLQEIKDINQRFMEVKVDVMNMDSVLKVGFDEGVVIRCSYVPVGPTSQQMVHKLPPELILPVKYPTISPTTS